MAQIDTYAPGEALQTDDIHTPEHVVGLLRQEQPSDQRDGVATASAWLSARISKAHCMKLTRM